MKSKLKKPSSSQKGLKKLPTEVRNKMGYAKKGAKVTKAKSGMKKMMGGGKCKNGC
jgi:phage-related protein